MSDRPPNAKRRPARRLVVVRNAFDDVGVSEKPTTPVRLPQALEDRLSDIERRVAALRDLEQRVAALEAMVQR